jgi:hypothetical protein
MAAAVLVDGATIKAALLEPRSNNEQYQGLLLARDSWAALPVYDRQITHKAIKSADMPTGSGRRCLADQVLKLPVYPEQPSQPQGRPWLALTLVSRFHKP